MYFGVKAWGFQGSFWFSLGLKNFKKSENILAFRKSRCNVHSLLSLFSDVSTHMNTDFSIVLHFNHVYRVFLLMF